ncbi:PP2C family protein-serine/threonine phosphatase [Actinomadura sp. WAC 06369]|uniref:PP2C family protein-serine/threonine phosphatase n=1 Tax=Actinomadura sp. WAC 06369 TaxID=2203193 RepID=UPI000F7AF027|nr:protein phosphatase 2C domain-containing protein [Actinomadura sp. WAC 06369]RSN46992.1 protein phosphatase [Actinomadura sp. WAC 06369]
MAHHALRFAVRSDLGRRRTANEDAAVAGPRLLAVADGMGGHPHGDVASRIAIEAVAGVPSGPGDPADGLAAAVASAAARLDELGRRDPGYARTGTTLTALAWDGARFAVAHIGDSRAYLLRGGDLFQLTRDHTMVQTLVDGGQLTPEEAADHPRGSVLVRALQSGTAAAPDLFRHDALPGDRYLLCSDGLSGQVPAAAIRDVLAGTDEPARAADRLVDLANQAGGPDNITCVVADVVPGPADGTPPAVAGAAAATDTAATDPAAHTTATGPTATGPGAPGGTAPGGPGPGPAPGGADAGGGGPLARFGRLRRA